MIFIPFIFLIVPLSISFGIGYWILAKANTQGDSLKTVGKVLGWVLISYAAIVLLFSGYFAIKMARSGYMQGGCPMLRMIQQQKINQGNQEYKNMPMMNNNQINK